MHFLRNNSAFGVSLTVHAILLFAMAQFQLPLLYSTPDVLLETVFSDERMQEEFSQELEAEAEIAESMNIVSGGTVSTDVGAAAGSVVNTEKIEVSEVLQQPVLPVSTISISLPEEEVLNLDLGVAEVTGEVGAVVEGYGAALSRMTQEIIRLLREKPALVVWLFDESVSMKDDQEAIRDKFHKVYEELGIIQQREQTRKRKQREILLSAIVGFGESVHHLTSEPTSDINAIRAAIDNIGTDKSGKENICQAITAVIEKYRSTAARTKRQLMVIVVTDESGDDGHLVEDTIAVAKRADAPVYILGREAVFGYKYARVRWVDPVYGLTHWRNINRGPETAYPEALQYDGLHARYGSFSSGFGPFEQVRLARETGGIFFLLPHEEETLAGAGAWEQRRFEYLALKEYQPQLFPRREYVTRRSSSEFRKLLWDVIQTLDPERDPQLSIQEWGYSVEPAKFRQQGDVEFRKAARAMGLLSQAVATLDKCALQKDEEDSQRWRAHFDLMLAQCLAYRVRLFQFMLAMDRHSRDAPKPKDERNNIWNLRRIGKMSVPDKEQFARIKRLFNIKLNMEEYLAELKQQEQRARNGYRRVIDDHPGTPWSQRADWEVRHGFGMDFAEAYYSPKYAKVGTSLSQPGVEIVVPNF